MTFIVIIFNQWNLFKNMKVDRSHDNDDEMLTDGEDGVVRYEFFDDNFMDGSPQNDQDQCLTTYRLTKR